MRRSASATAARITENADAIADRMKEDEDFARKHAEYRARVNPLNTAKLPRHDPGRTCPKCGADAMRIPVKYHWQSEDSWLPGGLFGRPGMGPCVGMDIGEHLDRTCGRCEYSWQERTLPQPPEGEPDETAAPQAEAED